MAKQHIHRKFRSVSALIAGGASPKLPELDSRSEMLPVSSTQPVYPQIALDDKVKGWVLV